MNKIEKQHLIKKGNLSQEYYFQSLLQEAYNLKLIADSELENIQFQCIELIAKETERYTSGESSSIRIETAQSIMQSICYTIGIYLKNLMGADAGLKLLKQQSLADTYKLGGELIKSKFEASRELLCLVQSNCLVTDNIAYNDTVQKGIASFFSDYDSDFAAQENPASIDYPLSLDKMDLVGIEYIHCYLEKLYLENEFCLKFEIQDIHNLLRGYDKSYKDLLINIFGLLINNLTGTVLADSNINLNIVPSQTQYLQQKLECLSSKELGALLLTAAENICIEFNVLDKKLQQHIKDTVLDLTPRLKNALENNQLNTLFIAPKEDLKPIFKFEEGINLEDELFRKITEEIRECSKVSDKIAIIKREVHSITDLVDMLEAYCIFENEFYHIFNSMENSELALLLKLVPLDKEKEWQKCLISFLENVDSAKIEIITRLSEEINF